MIPIKDNYKYSWFSNYNSQIRYKFFQYLFVYSCVNFTV